jgi:hypothetical protein
MSARASTNRVQPESATVLIGLAVKVPANREPSDTDTEKVATVVPAGELSGLRRCRADGNATPGRRRRQGWHLPLRVFPCVERLYYQRYQWVHNTSNVCAPCAIRSWPVHRRSRGWWLRQRCASICEENWTIRCGINVDQKAPVRLSHSSQNCRQRSRNSSINTNILA